MIVKRLLCTAFLLCALINFCSCGLLVPVETEWYEELPPATLPPETTAADPLVSYLAGEWVNDRGVKEPIDDKTVNGSPYTVKSISKDERGNITATLLVDNSDVVYTVYRYKVGYAEYCYMEALFTAKGITFKYSK